MKLSEVKEHIYLKQKIVGGKRALEDEALEGVIFEAMLFVASETIPIELTDKAFTPTNEEILRYLRDGKVVYKPEYPSFKKSERHLQIDEDLNFAVINKVCSLLSSRESEIAKFEMEASRLIKLHKSNSIKIGQ